MAKSRVLRAWNLIVFGSMFQAVVILADGMNFRSFYFTDEPTDVVVQKGQPAILNCSAVGDPSPTIEWKKDQLFLNLIGDTRRTILPNGSLRINNVTHSRNDRPDEGLYECVATVDNLGTIVSRTARLHVATLGRFEEEPRSTSVYFGDTAIFRCRVDAVPPVKIRWQKNRESLESTSVNDRFTSLPSGVLEIRDAAMSDETGYRCKATNIEGARRSEEERLELLSGGSNTRDPEFVNSPSDIEVIEGEEVILECAANGYPAPSMSWWKDGQTLRPSRDPEDHYSLVGGANLRIRLVSETDSATYRCSATNILGTVDARAELLVLVPPRFEKEPTSLHAYMNTDIRFECEVYGVPFPTIEWIKNGDIITPSEYFQIVEGTNLKILGLVKSDEGLYQCKAWNKIGNIQTSAQLIIADRGTDTSPANVMVPTYPRDVVPVTKSTRFVSLSWREPRITYGNIIAYSVYFRRQGSPRERVVNTTGIMEVTVRDLIPSTRYEFRVKAYNENGPGESSAVAYVETQPEVQVPGPVMNLRAVAVSTSAVKVYWDPPNHRNGDIVNYKVYYAQRARLNSEEDVNHIGLMFTKNGLKPYTEYTFRVVAYNENGPGVSSGEVYVRTYSDKPTAPPANMTIVAQSSKSLEITWDPPALEFCNGEITGYKLRWKQSERRQSNPINIEGGLRSFIVGELERDTEYEIRMAAMTVNGTGPSTDWMKGQTLENDLDETQVPPKPTSFKARPMTETIIVEWTPPPVEENIMVRGYTIGYGIGIADLYTHDIADPTRRHYTIKSLQPSSTYVISLRAYNGMGSGEQLYQTVTTRAESTPEPSKSIWPPVGVKAIVLSPLAVRVKWTDSSLNNKQRITDNRIYTVMYKTNYPAGSKTKFVNATALEYTIDELKPGTMYEFAVRVTKGKKTSAWSLSVFNKTFEATPGTPPRTLTIVPVEGKPSAINLNWQPPKFPNGKITGYVIYYTTDNSKRDHDWVIIPYVGDSLTATIEDLTTYTNYYFKIQARNDEGVGPMSDIVEYQTPQDDGFGGGVRIPGSVDFDRGVGREGPTSSARSEDEGGMSSMIIWIIIGCIVGGTVIAAVIVTIYMCKRRSDYIMAKKRKQGVCSYKAPPKGAKKPGAKDVKPPDLWIHHDQMELKQMEKPPMPEPMTQIPRNPDDMKPLDEPPMDTMNKRNSFVGDEDLDLTSGDRTQRPPPGERTQRPPEGKRKPIMIPVDPQPPPPRETIATATALPNGSVSPPLRPTYPKTQYSSPSVASSGSGGTTRNPIVDPPEFRVKTQFNYPMTRSKSLERPGFMTLSSSGYQSDNTTLSSDDGNKTLPPSLSTVRPGHPLKSFSVPGPPPHYSSNTATPQQKHLIKPGMLGQGSPHKKATVTVGGIKNRMQPVAVNAPRAPDVAIRERAENPAENADNKSFSTEDLNAEMANLEGLMKDLNAITATELEC
ncbi:neogenin-like isoform X3 [Glandiceps talaboti]